MVELLGVAFHKESPRHYRSNARKIIKFLEIIILFVSIFMIALVVCEWKLVYIPMMKMTMSMALLLRSYSLSRQYRISPLFPGYNGKFGWYIYTHTTNIMHVKVTYTIQGVFFFFNSFCGEYIKIQQK